MISIQVYYVFFSLFIAILIVYKYEVPTGISFFALSISYLLLGLIDTKELIHSFFDETLLTIVILIFISKAFEYNDLIKIVRKFLLNGKSKNVLFKLNLFSLVYSMFVNNAAVVSTMIGILNGRKMNHRLYLMAISFSAILGGMLTLVGTSTNLIVNNLRIKSGFPSWTLFDFFLVGLSSAILGFIYLSKAPMRYFSNQNEEFDLKNLIIEARVKSNSNLIGKSIEENGLRNLKKLFLGEIIRKNGKLISPANPTDIINSNDKLIFIGDIDDKNILEDLLGISVSQFPSKHLLKNLKEVIITDESDLIGVSVNESEFRSRFQAVIISICRGSQILNRNIGEIVFKSGDNLTLAVGPDFEKAQSFASSFILLDMQDEANNNTIKSFFFLLLFILALAFNFVGFLSLFKGTIIVLLFALIANIISIKSLKNEIPFNLITTVGSAFVISNVLLSIRAPEVVLSYVIPFLINVPVFLSLLFFFLFVILLTEFVSNSVAAGIAFPFALSLSSSLSIQPEPFFLVTAFGASASFLTPFGYHTNMMIYSIGHYRPHDFIKLGLPLTLIYICTVYISIVLKFQLFSL
jgi:di/tricarboxylate transporter